MPFTNSNSSPMSRQDEFIKTVSNEESCKRYECHIGHLFCRFFEASSVSVHYHVARSMRNAVGTRCVSFIHARQGPQGTTVPYTQSTSLSFSLSRFFSVLLSFSLDRPWIERFDISRLSARRLSRVTKVTMQPCVQSTRSLISSAATRRDTRWNWAIAMALIGDTLPRYVFREPNDIIYSSFVPKNWNWLRTRQNSAEIVKSKLSCFVSWCLVIDRFLVEKYIVWCVRKE